MKTKQSDGSYKDINQDKADKIKKAKDDYKALDKNRDKVDIDFLLKRIEIMEVILDLQ